MRTENRATTRDERVQIAGLPAWGPQPVTSPGEPLKGPGVGADEGRKMSDRHTAESVDPARGLDASSFQAPARQTPPAKTAELHVCSACGSDLVYPLDWSPTPDRRWSISLRCPDCEHVAKGIYEQTVVDRFDEELDRGVEEILDDLTLLSRANMEDQVERFVAALHAGHILAEDF
jgi:hypothetical protein